MPSTAWILALVELIFFVPTAIPTLCCLWKHRSILGGLLGWFFLFGFVLLQVVGAGMTLSAGENGAPSSTALLVSNIGISPLILGLAGLIHEWGKMCNLFTTKRTKTLTWIVVVLYHVAMSGVIAVYASGATEASNPAKASHGKSLAEAGILMIFALWAGLYLTFGLMSRRVGEPVPCKALFWSIAISMPLIAARLIYRTIATFKNDQGAFNPVTGSVALRVIFNFLVGALVVLVMITGGVMSINKVEEAKYRARAIAMDGSRGESKV